MVLAKHRSPIDIQDNGFALFPVILAVLIMGALIGFGLTLIGPRIKKEKYTQTHETIIAAIQAIVSWSLANGRLPDSSNLSSVVGNLDDAWRKSFVYVYDNRLASSSTGGICGRQSTNITSGTTTDIAFLLVSGGDDYQVDSTPNTSGQYTGNITASSKDIIRWVTLNELKNNAGCYANTLGRLRIINNELPRACDGQTYNAAIYAENGVPFATGGRYKWCLKGSLPNGVTSTPGIPGCPSTPDCSSLGTEASSQWSQADNFQLIGTPTAIGSYSIVVLVRDNNDNTPVESDDNCVQKAFLITVASCGGGP